MGTQRRREGLTMIRVFQEVGTALGIGHLDLETSCKVITKSYGRSLSPGEATSIRLSWVPVGPESCLNCRAGKWARGEARVLENELIAI
jgi:hypothetical protein